MALAPATLSDSRPASHEAAIPIIEVASNLGLQVTRRPDGGAWIPCPDTTHKNDGERPRCGLDPERNIFHCLKCDAKGDVVGLVKLVLECSAKDAFSWLRSHGFQADRPQGALAADPLMQLASVRGLSVESLKAMGCQVKADKGLVGFPMREEGRVIGWRYRRADGRPCAGGSKAMTVKGSKNGLMGVWPLPQEGIVLLTEGEMDGAAALSAGWPAVIATPGATPGKAVLEILQRLLAGRVVVLAPDADEAGEGWRDQLGATLRAAGATVRFIPPLPGMDLDKRLRGAADPKEELARLVAQAIELPPAKAKKSGQGAAPEGQAGEESADYCPMFDENGKPVPLGVAREIRARRPALVCVSGELWRFGGAAYELVDPSEIDADAIGLIHGKARRSILGDILHLLKVEAFAKPDFFIKSQGRFIQVQNGALDTATLELMPHSPDYRARNLLPMAYDPKADCPRFRLALEEWLPGDPLARQALVEWMGLALVPDTSFEKLLFLIGEGANGKGRYIRCLENLLGPANVAGLPLTSLRSDRTFMTAGLDGKLLNICPESELSGELDEGWLKSLISGDTVTVERKGRDPFQMRPVARFVVQSNNPPRLADRSEGIWRRLLIVRFSRTFTESERDPELDDKLAAELPGILNLALAGLHRLAARGRFEISPAMQAELDAYRVECNPLASWREERVETAEPDLTGRTPSLACAEAYTDYRDWCRDNGHAALSRGKFVRDLKRLGLNQSVVRDNAGRNVKAFTGVRLS